MKYLILITIFHILIDFIKELFKSIIINSTIGDFKKNIWKLIIFFLDQTLHIVIILKLTKDINFVSSPINEFLKTLIYSGNLISTAELKMVFVILYISLSGAYFIPLVLDVIYSNIIDYNIKLNNIIKSEISDSEQHSFIDEVRTGKWIGILERLLMLTFVFSNQFSAIGVIIAVKSLARFKMMDNKIFSEYYLLGTLFSVVYTICGYFIFMRMF